jgi:hypothetical protein
MMALPRARRQMARVEIGGYDAARCADLVREPIRDRAAAGGQFQAMPAMGDANAIQQRERAGIEKRLHRIEPRASALPGIVGEIGRFGHRRFLASAQGNLRAAAGARPSTSCVRIR